MQEYPKGSLLPSSWERRRSTTSGTGWGGAILWVVTGEEGGEDGFRLLYGGQDDRPPVPETLSQLIQDTHS